MLLLNKRLRVTARASTHLLEVRLVHLQHAPMWGHVELLALGAREQALHRFCHARCQRRTQHGLVGAIKALQCRSNEATDVSLCAYSRTTRRHQRRQNTVAAKRDQ